MTRPTASMIAHAALALFVYGVSVPTVALRWRAVLRGVTGRHLPLGPLVLASLASSFVNNVTAGPAGEACRVMALVRLRFASASRATAAIVYERLSEVPSIAVMAIIAIVVFGRVPLVRVRAAAWAPAASVVAMAAVAAAAGLWLLRARIARVWARLRDRGALDGIAIAPATMAQSAGWSAVVWVLDVTRIWLIARVFHVDLTVARAAALSAIAIVGGWAPTIGGLGVIEGGLIAGLLAFGVAPKAAVGITAVERGISYGIATAAGAGALAMLGGRDLWAAARARVGRGDPA